MISKRPISWFLTETGRKFSFGVVTSLGLGVTALKFFPNTFLLYKYKEFVHYYNNGFPVQLSSELENRVSECMDILNLSKLHKTLMHPFSVYGFDLLNAGSVKSKFGVAIGIPVNFSFKSLADIQKSNIMVNQKVVDWTSETGQKLADALILTEAEQKFAICREILGGRNIKLYLHSVYPFVSIFVTYALTQYINVKNNLYAAPLALRVCLYTLTSVFGAGIYFFLHDYTEVYYETEIDEELCGLGKEFIESGISFYDKLLRRNQALRELMGSEGERKYSKLGNENFLLRQPRIALIHRKQFFETKLKELYGEEEKVET